MKGSLRERCVCVRVCGERERSSAKCWCSLLWGADAMWRLLNQLGLHQDVLHASFGDKPKETIEVLLKRRWGAALILLLLLLLLLLHIC